MRIKLIVLILSFLTPLSSWSQTKSDYEQSWQTVIETLSSTGAPITDIYTLAELNVEAAQITEELTACSRGSNKTIQEIYLSNAKFCGSETQKKIIDLHSNFKQFLKSSLVENPDLYPSIITNNPTLIHPLFLQVLIEELSSHEIFFPAPPKSSLCYRTRTFSFGLCTGRLGQGDTPTLTQEDINILRIFSYLTTDGCKWGLWPKTSLTILQQIQINQGIVTIGKPDSLDIIRQEDKQYVLATGKYAKNFTPFSEAAKRIDDAYTKTNKACFTNGLPGEIGDIIDQMKAMGEIYAH